MFNDENVEYYRRREREEHKAIAVARSQEAAAAHRELADCYRALLADDDRHRSPAASALTLVLAISEDERQPITTFG